jgi:hypothetical protein
MNETTKNVDVDRAASVKTTQALVELLTVVRPKRVARALAVLVLVLVAVGAVANVMIYNVAPSTDHALAAVMKRFDLGHEPSIPNWYSSLALLAASVLLAVIAKAEKIVRSPESWYWAALSGVFFFLAVDEAVQIHEMAGSPVREFLNTGGALFFAWVIPYSVLVLLVGMFFLRFLIRLDSRTRRLFLLSAVLFVSGAIGIELIEGVIVDQYGVQGGFISLRLTIAQVIEEALEMFAIVLFIYSLLEYMQGHRILRVSDPRSAESGALPGTSGLLAQEH